MIHVDPIEKLEEAHNEMQKMERGLLSAREHTMEEVIEMIEEAAKELKDEANTLYWSLERLDALEGLNDDETPLFKRYAEIADQPTGLEED